MFLPRLARRLIYITNRNIKFNKLSCLYEWNRKAKFLSKRSCLMIKSIKRFLFVRKRNSIAVWKKIV